MTAPIALPEASIATPKFVNRKASDSEPAPEAQAPPSLNFKLMYGLVYQSLNEPLESLGNTCLFLTERVALFGCAHVPHLV